MLDPREIDIEIARLEYNESSYESYGKLDTLYIIRDHLPQKQEPHVQSSSLAAPAPQSFARDVGAEDSDFFRSVSGKDLHQVIAIMNELMDTLRVAYPRVYSKIMQQIESL